MDRDDRAQAGGSGVARKPAEAEKIERIGAWKVNPRPIFCIGPKSVYEIVEAPLDYKSGLAEGFELYDAESIPVLLKALQAALRDAR